MACGAIGEELVPIRNAQSGRGICQWPIRLYARPTACQLLPLAIELLWLASTVGPSAESLFSKGESAFETLIGSREANGREERKAT